MLVRNKAKFRFYEELNDFLPQDKKKKFFVYNFECNPSVKDVIEAMGIPHTEVDLILVNGNSVTFSYQLKDNDVVSVYPVFESLDISYVTHLREKPLRESKFVLDVHLGKLARYLRMLGFDTLYQNSFEDSEIIKISLEQKRTILTRDVALLKNSEVTHGYWIRSQEPKEQLKEVIIHSDLLDAIKPFYRCSECNGIIKRVSKESVFDKLQTGTKKYFNEFFQCDSCRKIYWKGSHYKKMERFIENFKISILQKSKTGNKEKTN